MAHRLLCCASFSGIVCREPSEAISAVNTLLRLRARAQGQDLAALTSFGVRGIQSVVVASHCGRSPRRPQLLRRARASARWQKRGGQQRQGRRRAGSASASSKSGAVVSLCYQPRGSGAAAGSNASCGQAGKGTKLRANHSLKRSASGRPPGPGCRYAVHCLQPGPGNLPLAPA